MVTKSSMQSNDSDIFGDACWNILLEKLNLFVIKVEKQKFKIHLSAELIKYAESISVMTTNSLQIASFTGA